MRSADSVIIQRAISLWKEQNAAGRESQGPSKKSRLFERWSQEEVKSDQQATQKQERGGNCVEEVREKSKVFSPKD